MADWNKNYVFLTEEILPCTTYQRGIICIKYGMKCMHYLGEPLIVFASEIESIA